MPLLCAHKGYHLPFYPHIWALTITPLPLAVLCDGFMPAAISRRSRRSAQHLVNLRSSCSMCEAERSSPSVSAIFIHLERVMNLGKSRIEMRIPRSAWFPRDLCFPHS